MKSQQATHFYLKKQIWKRWSNFNCTSEIKHTHSDHDNELAETGTVPWSWTCKGVWIVTQRRGGKQNTKHNTNKPLGWCEPASQPVSQPAGWAGRRALSWDNEENFMLTNICHPLYQVSFNARKWQNTSEPSRIVADWLTFMKMSKTHQCMRSAFSCAAGLFICLFAFCYIQHICI